MDSKIVELARDVLKQYPHPSDMQTHVQLARAVIAMAEADRLDVIAECYECRPQWAGETRPEPQPPPTCCRCGKPCVNGCWIVTRAQVKK